jgi:hypothetical protein
MCIYYIMLLMYAKKPFDPAPLIQKFMAGAGKNPSPAPFEDIDFFDFGSMGLFS